MRSTFGAIVVAALLATTASAQDDHLIPGAEPVPPSCVSGRKLTVVEDNFSIEAPGDDWRWLVKRDAEVTTYFCVEPITRTSLGVQVTRRRFSRFDDAAASEYLRGAERRAGKIENASFERSEIPLDGAYRIDFDFTTRGVRCHNRTYVFAEGFAYDIISAAPGRAAPPVLERFARSFSLLGPPRDDMAVRIGYAIGGLAVLIVPVFLVVGTVVVIIAVKQSEAAKARLRKPSQPPSPPG